LLQWVDGEFAIRVDGWSVAAVGVVASGSSRDGRAAGGG